MTLGKRIVRLAWLVGPLALAVAAVGNIPQVSPSQVRRHVVTGAFDASSASFRVRATTGQFATSTPLLSSASHRVQGGFWPLVHRSLVFLDGFETGDAAEWSARTP